VQGRVNLEALKLVLPIQRVYAFDLRRELQQRFVCDMQEQLGVEVIGVEEPKQAVTPADVIVTSGPILKQPKPTIDAGWVTPGAFASAVDFDSYWTGAALREFDRIATDDHGQFAYYREAGYFGKTPDPYADLGELVTGRKPGRANAGECLMAINLGIALEDMAVAPDVYARARERGLGTWLEL
jgi:ornithine cyclodeaminase/alanine dehydrogenase